MKQANNSFYSIVLFSTFLHIFFFSLLYGLLCFCGRLIYYDNNSNPPQRQARIKTYFFNTPTQIITQSSDTTLTPQKIEPEKHVAIIPEPTTRAHHVSKTELIDSAHLAIEPDKKPKPRAPEVSLAQLAQGFCDHMSTKKAALYPGKQSRHISTEYQIQLKNYYEKLGLCIKNIFTMQWHHNSSGMLDILLHIGSNGDVIDVDILRTSINQSQCHQFKEILCHARHSFPPPPRAIIQVTNSFLMHIFIDSRQTVHCSF